MRCARWGDSRTSISTTGRSTACDLRNHFVLIPLSPDVLAPWIRQLYFAFYFRLGSIRLTYLNGIAFIPRDVWYWRRKVDEKKRIIDYIKGSRPCEARVESSPRVAHVRNPCEFKVLNRVTGARVSVPFPSEREKKKGMPNGIYVTSLICIPRVIPRVVRFSHRGEIVFHIFHDTPGFSTNETLTGPIRLRMSAGLSRIEGRINVWIISIVGYIKHHINVYTYIYISPFKCCVIRRRDISSCILLRWDTGRMSREDGPREIFF